MKTVYLVRHGETNSNLEGKFQGRINTPLNAAGLAGAQGLIERFDQIQLNSIYCSNLQRTKQTAEPLAEARGLTVIEKPGLEEISFGKWEGLPFEVISQKWPEEYKQLYAKPSLLNLEGAETFLAAQERGWQAIKDIFAQMEDFSAVVAVSHGGLIRLILCSLLDMSIDNMWKFSLNNVSITNISTGNRLDYLIKYVNNVEKA